MSTRTSCLVAAVLLAGMSLGLAGCTATPSGMATHLAGQVINDLDVSKKSDELIGGSAAKCDEALGAPVESYRSEQPAREWRVYKVKNDLLDRYRYLVETTGGRVLTVSKADRRSDLVVDTATYAYFKERCMGNSAIVCQQKVGSPPALSARNVATGQLVQLYDARLVKDIQKPYYAVLRFDGSGGTCSQINITKVVASSADHPVVQ